MARSSLNRRPLHRQVADRLKREVLADGEAGTRLPSEAAMALRFKVSLTTIREALSALSQEGLLERRHGSGTYIADRRSSSHLAIITEMDISNARAPYFQLSVLRHLEMQLSEAGHATKLYIGRTAPGSPSPSSSSLQDVIDALAARRITGIVSLSTLATPDLAQAVARAGVPIVGSDPGYRHWVTTDRAGMVRQGVRHLIAAGCTRIAMQAWDRPGDPGCAIGGPSGILRSELAAAGLPVREGWIVNDVHPHAQGSGHLGFQRLWQAGSEHPDGLLICDDNYFAAAAMNIVCSGIRVPGDLRVATFANRGSGMMSPFPVARLELDPEAYAAAMVSLLQRLLRGEGGPDACATVPFSWVIQERSDYGPGGAAPSATVG